MSERLSDTRLAEIRERYAYPHGAAELLAEVDRLRAVVEDYGREAVQYEADYDRLRADLRRIQHWATTTVHGSAAAEVLLLIRNLPAAPTT